MMREMISEAESWDHALEQTELIGTFDTIPWVFYVVEGERVRMKRLESDQR